MSQNLKTVAHGANVIGYVKNGIKYGATIAWGCQVDYDKMVYLMGSQSATGNNISKGDIIGITALNEFQMAIGEQLGTNHSNEFDKWNGIDYTIDQTAIIVNEGYSMAVCEVIDVLHLEGIEEDNLVYVKVLKSSRSGKKPLHYE